MGILIFVFGVAFAGMGVFFTLKHQKLKKICTAQTDGYVQDIVQEESRSSNDDGTETSTTMHYPVFAYSVNGSQHVKRSSTGSARTKLVIGQKVTVFYNPEEPGQHYVLEDKASSTSGIVFMIAGVVIMILGIVVPYIQQ
ncbi:MAG: DUF3592 domain-containing protein [Clostridiales bacterium]|nr:DUF3592 domain-containing protein [Clostridiales bacterium]